MNRPSNDRVLRLREYQRATIGNVWDPVRLMITSQVAGEIERVQAGMRNPIFNVGRRTIQAQQYVGTLGGNGWAIDILPKVDQGDGAVRDNLISMLTTAGMVPSVESGLAAMAGQSATLIDTFLSAYVSHLAIEWRRGRISNYRGESANRTCLKGKLRFPEHLRHNLLRPERFYTRADEFLHDVPLARLLKAGLQVCRHRATSAAITRAAGELLQEFVQVDDVRFTIRNLNRIGVDRRTERFGPLVELAKLLLSETVPERSGAGVTYSFLFDMNVVFERYIGQLLKRSVCPPSRRADLQHTGKSLLLRDGRKKFNLQPDIAIFESSRLACLVDTKWKRLDPNKSNDGVSQADMYQMYAYGKEYGCPRVILLYPRTSDMEHYVARYDHHPSGGSTPQIEVWTVDVRKISRGGDRFVGEQLRKMLHAMSSTHNELSRLTSCPFL